MEFFRLFSDEDPFYTQYYRNDDDPIVCGHRSFNEGPIKFTNYFLTYQQGEEWMESFRRTKLETNLLAVWERVC